VTWTDAASLDDARAARRWLARTAGGIDLVLVAMDGDWLAVEDRCSHAGCAFSEDGELHGAEVICNCHGSEFDVRTGEVRRGPAERSIRTFAVRVAGDRLEVDV
jgi:nitrite reductase/ring-hydroxylating ferredoxin subunit